MDDSLSEAQQQQILQSQKQIQESIQQVHGHTQQGQQQQKENSLQPYSQSQSPQQLDQSNQQQQNSQPESDPVHPKGEEPPKIVESSGIKEDQVAVQQQANGESSVAIDQSNVGFPGLNPAAAAAVAALAQLTQFAGTMSAAERAILELGLQQLSSAGGYGMMAPFQGFGQGPMHFQDHRSSYWGGGRRGRGRGRGRGPSRGGPRHNPPSTSSSQEPSAVDVASGPTEEHPEPSSDNQQNNKAPAEAPNQTTVSAANVGPRVGWCEVCQVRCTSLEILEQQHKNGKRHKKNLLKMGESLPPENADKDTEENPTVENRGAKRMMRGGGRGGKRVKTSGGIDQPKVVIPLICDLCNVKCDTKEVFDRHLAGKKHIAKVKRYEGHQAMYGPVGLQVLYPPNPITQTLFNPATETQQGPYGPPGSSYPPGAYVDPQAYYAATGSGLGYEQNPDPNAASNVGAQN